MSLRLEDAFLWFGCVKKLVALTNSNSIGEHAISYYVNHLLSAQAQAWIALAVIVPLFLLCKGIRICGICDLAKHKQKLCFCIFITMALLEMLLGFFTILLLSWCFLLLSMFSVWHVSVGCIFCSLFWSIMFCHCNRVRFVHPDAKKHEQQDQELKQENEKTIVKKLDTGIVGHLKTYPMRFACGIKKRWFAVIPVVLLLIGFAIFINLLSCNMCVCSQPIETSTSFTRRFGQKYCRMLRCHIYYL